jgi:hypothetical protein
MCLDSDHVAVVPVAVTSETQVEGNRDEWQSRRQGQLLWYTKGLGAVMINNPNYGKMESQIGRGLPIS